MQVNCVKFANPVLKQIKTIFFILLGVVLFANSCRKEKFFNGATSLSFNQDTVYFDTIFTRINGTKEPRSRNMQLVVRNTENKTIKTSIKLASGAASPFRLNIDGQASNQVTDYEIRGGDSIFIFVECILETNNLLNPALVVDSIEFNTQGKLQDVKLAAYGWDAYYFNDSVLPCNSVWDKTDKPYVIINSVAVDENCKLTIEKGVHIHASPNSKMYILGTLIVNGIKNDEVIFEGDRLQYEYRDRPGQWRGIHLLRTSKDNQINYAIIKNAQIGIQIDSLSNNTNPKLLLENTIIKNMTSYGIAGLTAHITAINCLVHSCGFQSFAGIYGGKYDIRHCTFYGFSSKYSSHTEPVFAINNYLTDGNGNIIRTFDVEFGAVNNIIFGNLENEVSFSFASSKPPTAFAFIKNIIKVKKPENYPTDNLINIDPFLVDAAKDNFELNNGSPAINKGLPGAGVLLDLNGKTRDATPDMGAFEF